MGEPTTEIPKKGGLTTRIIPPEQDKKDEEALEQSRVFVAVRAVLKPFEDEYHGQVPELSGLVWAGKAEKKRFSDTYTMRVSTSSGREEVVIIKTTGSKEKPRMKELGIASNWVFFDREGRITDIILRPTSTVLTKIPQLPQVSAFRKQVVGDQEYPHEGYHHAQYDLWFSTKSPTEMSLKIKHHNHLDLGLSPYAEKRRPLDTNERNFSVQADGTLKETSGYPTKVVNDKLSFPDLVKGAMEAIDPANN